MMPKAVDHDERRFELIAASWRTIRRVGMAKTNEEIAKESGYTHGLPAYCFPDKNAILRRRIGTRRNRCRIR